MLESNFVPGLMMDSQLTVTSMLQRANAVYPEKQIVSYLSNGTAHRYNYSDLYSRVLRLMNALRTLGVGRGDVVATMAWNSYRHLELYFAVPALGAILHTVNFRLFPEQRTYLFNHGRASVIFVDLSLVESLAEIQAQLTEDPYIVVMDDSMNCEPASIPEYRDYEDLMSSSCCDETFPELDERAAASLCYTSGTTGDPKGVVYSHRSLYLHSLGCCTADSLAVSERDILLPVVPMFHANAWGVPYACALTGAAIVLPGSQLTARSLASLIETERVTIAVGVPTIWNLLYQYLQTNDHDLSSLKLVLSGGAAAPASLIENYQRNLGITLVHAWGMTETSPVGSVCRPKTAMDNWESDRLMSVKEKQGLPVAGIEMRIVDPDGVDLPRDGAHAGELLVRGPWVASQYYRTESPGEEFTTDGWFRTGDIATIDPMGYMQITDRQKDVIKSRGEWISSVAMESLLSSHPDVLEAAVVARHDDLRGEAPVAFVVFKDHERPVSSRELIGILKSKFERWQLPKSGDILVVDVLPRTGVGKVDKKQLRARLEPYFEA